SSGPSLLQHRAFKGQPRQAWHTKPYVRSNGAIYRIHDLSLTNKHKVMMMDLKHFPINLLTKGVPIPPSAPSKRHNVQPDDAFLGSTPAKDGQRD
ncbi:hypothetical protein Gotri_019117, partial [Gossypium trilobum]|nr:hypothetical protein [Gossypium trilobum]